MPVAVAYLDLFDRFLEDRQLDEGEVAALASAAADRGIGTDTAAHLHWPMG